MERRAAVAVYCHPVRRASAYVPLLFTGIGDRYRPRYCEDASLDDAVAASDAGETSIVHVHWEEFVLRDCRSDADADADAAVATFARRIGALRARRVPIAWTIHNEVPHEIGFARANDRGSYCGDLRCALALNRRCRGRRRFRAHTSRKQSDMALRYETFTAADGRTLDVLLGGSDGGPALLVHHGTPSDASVREAWDALARARGRRLVSVSRPGYGGSTRKRGRAVADAADDARVVPDAYASLV